MISLFGSELRNLPDSEADFWLERRPLRVSFRLSAVLRNVGRYFVSKHAGNASVLNIDAGVTAIIDTDSH